MAAITLSSCFAVRDYTVEVVQSPGHIVRAFGIAEDGALWGSATANGQRLQAAIWRQGTVELLGQEVESQVLDMNRSGLAAGYTNSDEGLFSGTWTGTSFNPVREGLFTQINDQCWVAGSVGTSIWLHRNGQFIDIPVLDDPDLVNYKVIGLNNGGMVVGDVFDDETSNHAAWVWTEQNGMVGLPPQIFPMDLNEDGVFLDMHGGLFRGSDQVGLVPMQVCYAMNELGDVLGYDFTGWSIFTEGSVYGIDSLLAPEFGDWSMEGVRDINDRGQILGLASFGGGDAQTVLLTPVPEPGTLAALGLGALLIANRRSKRQHRLSSPVSPPRSKPK